MNAIRTVLEITPRPGLTDEVIRLYRSERVIETAVERGLCIAGELLVPDDDGPLIVTCTWANRDAYAQWVDTRPGGLQTLYDLLDLGPGGLPAGRVYDIEITTHTLN